MGGTSLASVRRARDPLFTERVFVGRAIDIGAGGDPLRVAPYFPELLSVTEWDLAQGDALEMRDVPAGSFDLVYSSHCLEHIAEATAAFSRWWQLVKPGGHLVLVVPDFRTYEREVWPSVRNPDHKQIFTVSDVFHLAGEAQLLGSQIVRLEVLDEGFVPNVDRDQTADRTCECGIELVLRRARV